ncbi:uncharacterized protein LOC116119332 [Pistacia vera]|uniref:uncharacterized protein LOC116119332 n=1 Tax=Pistacia vera TaxID=55513 RepID=UPI0012637EDF|nr:uncharacterized protein LOC116119332 [Pistacia vera]
MEDHLESSADSSSTHTDNSSNTSRTTDNFSNTPRAVNMARYLNLSDPGNPFRLDNDNNPVVVLVTDLLTTDNYATWSHAMQRALQAKNKLGFITGIIPQPSDPTDPLLELWERCNDMIVSWIQNSINPSIMSSVVFVDDAREI